MINLYRRLGLGGCGLLATALLLGACETPPDTPPPADLVLRGGEVVSLAPAIGTQQALAVRGSKIVAVGSDQEIGAYVGADTEVIELGGRAVIPGLIEGHGHFLSLGRSKQILDLTQAESFADIVAQVAAAADGADEGVWIFGRGWHQDKWREQEPEMVDGVPLNRSLNRVSPDNPVLLGHASGHAAYANDAALAAAGIDDQTPDPAGGTIVRDQDGRATGLLRETAQRLVSRAGDAYLAQAPAAVRDAQFRERVALAGREALAYGVTSFHDAGASFAEIEQFRELEQQGGLPVRLYVMVRGASNEEMASRLGEFYMPYEDNDFLTVRSIKRQIDGALGAHGAWLLEPYADLTTSTGLVLETVGDIEETARIAIANGYQVNTHAIGTRANREVLDLYERIWAEAGADGRALRWRIEHAQHVHPADVPRFGQLGVIAAVQGVHCTSDGPWIPSRLGAARTALTSYRWRDFLDTGARLNNGTDAPVESLDPFASLHASVARVMNTGEAFHAGQAMTRLEALRSYTIDNAFSAFEEDAKGTLEPGKLADLVVLSQNLLTVPAERIPETRVLYTIVGGDIRYEAD